MNHVVCTGTGLPPITLFTKEKEHLNPLPQNDLTSYYCKAEVTVNNQQLIYYKGSMYSVDKSYIGETLRIEECSDKLLLYYKSSLIEIHQISNNRIRFILVGKRIKASSFLNVDENFYSERFYRFH